MIRKTTFPTLNQAVLLTAGVSAALLIGAHIFEYLGYAPCDLCLKQRLPHWVNIAIGILALIVLWRGMKNIALLLLLGMAGALSTTAAIAAYHVGVEQKWWQGPSACSANTFDANVSVDDLLAQIQGSVVIPCDQATWSLFGISMAGYNFLISMAAVLFALWAILRIKGHDQAAR